MIDTTIAVRHRTTILFALMLLVVVVAHLRGARGQAEVLAVTSFRDCTQLDPTVQGKGIVGATLNCSRIATAQGSQLPPVTTMDLRLVPGLSAEGSSFDIDLSVVLNEVGAPSTTSRFSTRCDPNAPETQLCVATTSAKMQIRTSQPVFAYDLSRFTTFEIPYCYASLAQFETFASDVVETTDDDGDVLFGDGEFACHASSLLTSRCGTTARQSGPASDHSLSCTLNSKTAIDTMLKRVQIPYPQVLDPTADNFAAYLPGFSKGLDSNQQILLATGAGPTPVLPDVAPIQSGPTQTAVYECANGFCQGNLYRPKRADVSDPDTACCDPRVIDPQTDGYCESRNIDVRVPAVRPVPLPFGYAQRNLAVTRSDETELMVRNETAPNRKVWKGETETMASVGCASPRCAANRDRRRIYGTPDDPSFPPGTAASFNASRHLLLPLLPTCSVYRIEEGAKVIVDVEIDVTVQVSDPDTGDVTEVTETLSISNFNVGESSSSLQKLIRARFENIESTSAFLGPSIDGYIVVCGRQGAQTVPDFIDMRYLLATARGVDVSQVPLTDNPWPTIIETWKQNAKDTAGEDISGERQHYFPHPFDYVQPGVGRGKESGSGLPDDLAQSFWYYVPEDLAVKEWGTGCNQVGVGASFSASTANQESLCRLPPHECAPGMGQFFNGGLKTSVPCTVSSMFMFASGMQSAEQQAGLTGASNSRFSFTLDEAKRFMPNDEFTLAALGNASLTQSSAPLYDTENPNFWLSGPAPRLMYQPTGGQALSSTVTAEIVVDFVGSFVRYEEQVALGRIVQPDALVCNATQGEADTEFTLFVENVSTPGSGVATSYELRVACNTTESGLAVLAPDGGVYIVNDLEPGATSGPLVYRISQDGSFAQKGECTAVLTSATDVVFDPIMDTVTLNCNVNPTVPPPFPTPANDTATPVSPQTRSCGTCDLSCKAQVGGIWGDPCFLAIIIVTILIFAAAASVPILYIYFKNRDAIATLEYTKSASKEVDARASDIRERVDDSADPSSGPRQRRQESARIDRDDIDEARVDGLEDDD